MRLTLAFVAVVGCFLLVGCGPSQPVRSSFEGKVTYEGKPVTYGMIYFNPDITRGNKGVYGIGEINDGVYQTNPGYGATPGPMLLTFQIFDAKPPENHRLANIVDVPVDFSTTASRDFDLTAKDIKPIQQ
jgi:ABC-type oligopeptide transport system substrate-binding subunit